MHSRKFGLAALFAAVLSLFGCTAQEGSTPASTPETTAAAVTGELTLTVLDVGKADAMVLQTPSSVTVIDTGNKGDGKDIEQYLSAQGITKIDTLIITHFDKDHVGGAARLINRMEVGVIYTPDYESKSDERTAFEEKMEEKGYAADVLSAQNIREWSVDGALFRLYAPNETYYGKNEENDFSLVLWVQHGEKKFLFAGDAEAARQQEIMDYGLGTADFLKFPYHGNYLPNTEEFLDAVQPAYTVVCCSEKEDADPYTAETLEKRKIETYYTKNGTVTVRSDGKSLTVTQG